MSLNPDLNTCFHRDYSLSTSDLSGQFLVSDESMGTMNP